MAASQERQCCTTGVFNLQLIIFLFILLPIRLILIFFLNLVLMLRMLDIYFFLIRLIASLTLNNPFNIKFNITFIILIPIVLFLLFSSAPRIC